MPFFGSLAGFSVRIVSGPPVVNPLTNDGNSDAFVVKYDSSGTPQWARRMGGAGTDEARSVRTDSSGNIVVTGYYNSTPLRIFAANGTTVSFTLARDNSDLSFDSFVVKYDPNGTPLWARRIGGTSSDITESVSTDSSGNVIVAGLYTSTPLRIYAANGSTVSLTLTGAGYDAFVVKYDSSGTPLWARRLGGSLGDEATSVSTDSSGNIVVAGWYQSNPMNIYAANGTTVSLTLANSGDRDVFVVKYDSAGTPLWARRLGGAGGDVTFSLSVDSSGNIFVAGYYGSSPLNIYAANGSTVSFTLANVNSNGSNDGFVVKYDSSGTWQWARRIGGSLGDEAFSVSTDSSGNVIVAGFYTSNPLDIFLENVSTVSFTLSNSGGGRDVFVVKYDPNGTPLWARRMGGTGNDLIRSAVSVDSSGNIFMAGYYTSATLNVFAANGSTVLFTLAGDGSSDIFVVKYDSSGTPLWARRMIGTGADQPNSVSTDSSGNIVVAGTYSSNPLVIS
jgi:hypothetical protein